MQLERGASGGVRRLTGREFGGGEVGGGERERGAQDERAGEFQGDLRVGQPVLDCLERAYGSAELGALLDVGDGLVEQGEADAEGLRRSSETGQGEGLLGGRGRGEEFALLQGGEAAGGVEGRADRAVSGGAEQAFGGEDEAEIGRVSVQGVRAAAGHRRHTGHGHSALGEQDGRRDGLDQRAGYGVPAQLDEGQGEFDGPQPIPPVLLRYGETEHPGLLDTAPQRAPARMLAPAPLPDDRRGVRGAEHRVQGGDERPLFGVGQEAHQRRPFGRPSSRSAMMSRWISFVPA